MINLTEQQGEHFCSISGNMKDVGDMCENNPNPKKKCRNCVHLKFMKFKEAIDDG